ncbi:hypothetical protein N7495_006371 [Penicillium taxi]|uniref:uncharacterized protein n=1 Tax=Penicillium taxi TaxID=168475 RepID=UPI002545856C|nr:uncharacterized protein N7495_006371 [Penicillium taxi]KAJ5894680.1 hypothetical protein N7495_006371 [Penicillium taxi]
MTQVARYTSGFDGQFQSNWNGKGLDISNAAFLRTPYGSRPEQQSDNGVVYYYATTPVTALGAKIKINRTGNSEVILESPEADNPAVNSEANPEANTEANSEVKIKAKIKVNLGANLVKANFVEVKTETNKAKTNKISPEVSPEVILEARPEAKTKTDTKICGITHSIVNMVVQIMNASKEIVEAALHATE